MRSTHCRPARGRGPSLLGHAADPRGAGIGGGDAGWVVPQAREPVVPGRPAGVAARETTALHFDTGARDTRVTQLTRATADGPWRVLRARSGPVCEATLVQARGGMVDGDRWRLEVVLGRGARVRLRTLGAQILHRGTVVARLRLRLGPGARLSWRPLGLIAFDGARASLTTIVDLEPHAVVAVAETIAVPRAAFLSLRLLVHHRRRLWHAEWTSVQRSRHGPAALGEATHLGEAWRFGPGAEAAAPPWHHRVSCLGAAAAPRPGVVVARALGYSLQQLDEVIGPLVEEEVSR